ncbi:MAG: GH3 auxin-responsive promoter family protein [bacterium]|nr:GH3 auxin-responsive promoter family protein [bacterium]
MSGGIGYLALKTGLWAKSGRLYRDILSDARSPDAASEALLRRILAQNAETSFGQAHGFARIQTAEQYRQAVPVQTYESLRELIERQELTGERCLTAEQPVFYNRTSGTTAAPKNIPVTDSALARIGDLQRLTAYAMSRHTSVLTGKVFSITGAAAEGAMPGGTPFGSASGLLNASQGRLVKRRYVLPAEVAGIANHDARYLLTGILGAAERAVTCLATANPSTLVRLMGVINDNAGLVIDAVAKGRTPAGLDVGAMNADTLLRPQPQRATELEERHHATGRLRYADLWPQLAGVLTWTGGSCGVAVANLRPLLPENCPVFELGYLASEVTGTVNLNPHRAACVPTLGNAFFEFAPSEEWETADRSQKQGAELLSLEQLEEGRDYYVIVTTASGLYRYDMSDIVRVNGCVQATPTLAFVQKGKGITSITGEKLHEGQAISAVTSVLGPRGLTPDFFIMLADADRARYLLYLEVPAGQPPFSDLARQIDERLAEENVEYKSKRASSRLNQLAVKPVIAGTGDAFRRQLVAGGQRDVQFKYLHLQYRHQCAFDFEKRVPSAEDPASPSCA